MKANQEKKPIDFYLYTYNSPCASNNANSEHSSCMKNMFLATHKIGSEWGKIGHHLDVGFVQWYLSPQHNNVKEAKDNFCKLRKEFEKEFSEKSITFSIIQKTTASNPCPN